MAGIQNTIGNYHLLEELASGSFGRVYRGEHAILTTRIVAIKLMHGVHLNSQKERESFIQEALILEKLKHPHILPIIDVGIHEGFPYLVTEYAPHGSLRQRLQRQPQVPLPEAEAITILSHIAQALYHAHQQHVIHRDLKPENILFNAKNEALLADFGIATVMSTLSPQQATIIGTPAYMAPEQFQGKVSQESDQYALACIAYELFTGKQPFQAPDFISMGFKHLMEQPTALKLLNPQVPTHIEQAILAAMAKDRANRHADVHAFLTALQRPQKSPQQWLQEGNRLYNLKRYEEALAAYEQAIRLNPNDASAYNNKGAVLDALKQYEEALAAYNQAIRLDPNEAITYNNKGDVLKKLRRSKEAPEQRGSVLFHGMDEQMGQMPDIAEDPTDVLRVEDLGDLDDDTFHHPDASSPQPVSPNVVSIVYGISITHEMVEKFYTLKDLYIPNRLQTLERILGVYKSYPNNNWITDELNELQNHSVNKQHIKRMLENDIIIKKAIEEFRMGSNNGILYPREIDKLHSKTYNDVKKQRDYKKFIGTTYDDEDVRDVLFVYVRYRTLARYLLEQSNPILLKDWLMKQRKKVGLFTSWWSFF